MRRDESCSHSNAQSRLQATTIFPTKKKSRFLMPRLYKSAVTALVRIAGHVTFLIFLSFIGRHFMAVAITPAMSLRLLRQFA